MDEQERPDAEIKVSARVLVQFLYFDRRDAPAGARFRVAEAALVSLFGALSLVYGAAAFLGGR